MLIYPDEMAKIKAHPLFSHMQSDSDIKWFIQCMDGKLRTEDAGARLCTQGERTEFVPIVLEGETDAQLPPFSVWEQIESQSGLSHSVAALVPPLSVNAKTECLVLWLKVMRLLKPCNRHCDFHETFVEKLR